MHDLEEDWVQEAPGEFHQISETLKIIGGGKGFLLMVFVLYVFYLGVEWYITSARIKREEKRKKK
jgi:hypothetical protein